MRKLHGGPSGRLRWAVIILCALAVLTAVNFFREYARSRQIDREIAALRDEADRLRAKNFEIRSLQVALEKQEFFEREARTKLNFQKEGERVVILHKPSPADLSAEALANAEGERWSNPKLWWTYFADRKSYDDYARGRN